MGQTAEERGMEMMSFTMKEIPPLALAFAKKLCVKLGMCGEVSLTAWTVYAQCVEGLVCTDDLYQAQLIDRMWFKENRSIYC